MRLRDDERGQSVQIGAVLLFATLVIAFSSYQAFVVPDQNREVEFNHNQQVQGELQELRNAVVSMVGGGSERSTAVTLGTTYPSRAVALNPPTPIGRLRTVGTGDDAVSVRIENAVANSSEGPEAGDFWNTTDPSYDTGAILYRPGYNVYDDAPTTVYENSVLYNEFDGSELAVTDQTMVTEDRISLVVLNGSLDRTASGSTSVDSRPLSASTETVELTPESDGDPMVVTVPSRQSEAFWNEAIPDDSGVTARTGDADLPAPFRPIELVVEKTYTFQLTKVGVGSGATREDSAYLTFRDSGEQRVTRGDGTDVVLQVRDAYGNPVSDATVDGRVRSENGGTLDSSEATTDRDGAATFRYETGPNTDLGEQVVDFSYDEIDDADDARAPESASARITVEQRSGGGGDGGDGGDGGTGGGGTGSGNFVAYPYAMNDGDGSGDEPNEDDSIPPADPRGNFNYGGFPQITQESGSTYIYPANGGNGMDVGVALSVPDSAEYEASQYTLEIRYQRPGWTAPTDVYVVDAGGTVMQQAALSVGRNTLEMELDDDAAGSYESENALYVVYHSDGNVNLELEYHRLVGES